MDERPITWDLFVEAFLEKYFPSQVRDNMEVDFMRLKQGSRSVVEYEEQFTALS